jgi:hypothetical protein
MARPPLEVADVFRRYGPAYRVAHAWSSAVRRVMRAIECCRTAALGGHVEACDACGHQRIAYNSCANRHCPKCQSLARAAWLERRQADLLPVEYFHVVFTLPAPIAALALANKKTVYAILFRAAADTLRTIAADPHHLGAEIGFIAVLHTWGHSRCHHPHIHCVVPGGGLSPDGTCWVPCRPGFFLPVRVLSRLFRRRFLDALQHAFDAGTLRFVGALAPLHHPDAFATFLQPLRQIAWVVYAKPPFGGPAQVLAYLGRYTHRVAIANHRLVSLDEDHVTCRWTDYRRDTQGTMRLPAAEFIRRFLLHALPDGFPRIRHYGFLGNRVRQATLAQCRRVLGVDDAPRPVSAPERSDYRDRHEQLTGTSLRQCPVCDRGQMVRLQTLFPPALPAPHFARLDSS